MFEFKPVFIFKKPLKYFFIVIQIQTDAENGTEHGEKSK